MDPINSELDNFELKTPNEAFPTCGICGELHESSDCDIVKLQTTIIDTPVLSKARLSLPANLELVAMADGSFSVITKEPILKGTRFGPYDAKVQFSIPLTTVIPLKVFKNGDGLDDNYFKEFYLNTSNEYECNWMYFVNKANNLEEQNLMCFQDNGQIFYISLRDIKEREHLQVWYSPYYGKLMKTGSYFDIPEETLVIDTEKGGEDIDINALMMKQQNIRERKTWICKFCGLHEDNIKAFALHISNHYVYKMMKSCEICNERFNTTMNLRKHMILAHNELFPEESTMTLKNESVEVKTQPQLDPLLNEEVSGENNILLEHLNYQDSSNLSNEPLTLNVETLLNEDENFNFDLTMGRDPEEKFVCDICLKEFSKLKMLVVHLNAHTGKYACSLCHTVFVRKENLVAHKCLNNTSTEVHRCPTCNKLFTLRKYLTRHLARAHGEGLKCPNGCPKIFCSEKSLKLHACELAKPKPQQSLSCNLCSKKFGNSKNLTRHMKVHEKNLGKAASVYICEICSKQFHSLKVMKQHLTTHKDPVFCCELCNKTFQRRSTFLEHMESHKNESPHECTKCDAKFSRKKYLTSHLLTHTDELKFTCPECPQKFKHKMNLSKHHKLIHAKNCKKCDLQFETIEEQKQHMQSVHAEENSQAAAEARPFACPVCDIRVQLRSSLKRHVKKKHNEEYDMSKFDQYINEIKKKANTLPNAAITNSETDVGAKLPKKLKVEVLSDILVKPQNKEEKRHTETKEEQPGPIEIESQSSSSEKMSEDKSQVDSNNILTFMQNSTSEILQSLEGNMQLNELVDFIGSKPSEIDNENGNLSLNFQESFNSVLSKTSGMTHTFDGTSVCLSMPELTDANGQPIQFGADQLPSPFLNTPALNGTGDQQLVLYIVNQKPDSE